MEILIAKTAGFCYGVKRAIKLADQCAEADMAACTDGESSSGTYTLGPIIHNPQVVKKLEEKHIISKETLDDIEGGTVIIRSHGVRLDEFEEADARGLKIVDATCPFVKKAQELVSELAKDGYSVVVLGDHDHPEVQGLASYGGKGIRVVTSSAELVDMSKVKKIGIVAQTTQSMEALKDVTSICLGKAAEVKVYNTICNATSLRQTESVGLAERVDVMIVVGGKNSANTKRLAEICSTIQPKTYHIEVADELMDEWTDGSESVGITAGASTPRWVIEEVIDRIGAER